MVTGTPAGNCWPADVASLVAGATVPAIVLAMAEAMTVQTLLGVWMVLPLHAGRRVLTDVRHGLACWSAARLGASHARGAFNAASTQSNRNVPTNLPSQTSHKAAITHKAR
jgi:hypothetical protein